MGIIGHMIATAIGVFFRVIFMALVWGAIAAGVTLLLSSMWLKQGFPPPITTDIIGAAVVLLAAYAGGTTTVLRAITRGLLTVAKDVEHDVSKVV